MICDAVMPMPVLIARVFFFERVNSDENSGRFSAGNRYPILQNKAGGERPYDEGLGLGKTNVTYIYI